MAVQGFVTGRLLSPDVQAGGPELAAVQGLKQGFLVYVGAPGGHLRL